MTKPKYAPSSRATVKQAPTRAHYETDLLCRIIDEAIIATVAIVFEQQPFALPMAVARIDDHIYLHGSRTSRLMKHLVAGHELCVTFSLLDGIVVSRSGMHCSANYRSAVVHGRGKAIEGEAKAMLLHQVVEAIIPSSKHDFRDHLPNELKATALVAIPLNEAACKIRTGDPKDDPKDINLPYWAGVIPVERSYGTPTAAKDLPQGIATPEYALKYPLR